MKGTIAITTILAMIVFVSFGQKTVVIDGDKVVLSDTLGGREVSVSYIERGLKNQEAIWICYDRRPGVDPWILETEDRNNRFSDETFINYFKEKGINILGAITTYDNCNCAGKCRAMHCPDMYLIHFKISKSDWAKVKDLYPEMGTYLKDVKLE